ncbi:MAG: Gfo/Idh/MocA family oxidoreductase [Agriterribacter sp.]
MKRSRRVFLKNSLAASAALSIGGILPGFSAKSYARIAGANERIQVAIMGVNARGLALSQNFSSQKNCEVIYISDVDSRAMDKCVDTVTKIQGSVPKAAGDFRKALEDKAVEAIVIATPDHWHAPAAILSCKAGKHVYVEKPCSHNPHEGELLVAAAKKYKRKVQMGSQRRSWPNIIQAIQEVKGGVIGRTYYGKGWYANNRASIGTGKKTAIPSWLNFELWQGPAPREDYRDNILHYNWHWFWNWGTGEGGNNGVHTIDLLRWGMEVEYPKTVTSTGGRFRYKDDWETPDTQVATWTFGNNTMIEWEGRSCNSRNIEDSGVGVVFYGDNGSLVISAGNAYKIYDQKNKLIKEVKDEAPVDARNTVSPSQALDALHIQNFFDGIKKGSALNADIEIGHKSTLLNQLANIAQRTSGELKIDDTNGHIIGNKEAAAMWKRKYAPDWEPSV